MLEKTILLKLMILCNKCEQREGTEVNQKARSVSEVIIQKKG